MDHLASQFDLSAGDTVEVRIDQPTNVHLMDAHNYQLYGQLRSYHAVGGGFTAGVVRLAAPTTGRWLLVLDLGGRAGIIHHSDPLVRRAA